MNGKVVVAVVAVIAIAAAAGGASVFVFNQQQSDDVTYSLDGGTNSPDNRSSYGGNTIVLSDPFRTGYDFSGWYTDSGFMNQVTSVSPDNGKITLYAKWGLHDYQIKYAIDHDAKNDNPKTCTIEDIIILKSPELKGYTFDGWYLSDGGEKVTELSGISSDVSIRAEFTPIEYGIIYHSDGAAENDNPDSITIEDEIELNDPVKAGYTFDGWYTSDSFSEDSRIEILKEVASESHLYAKWTVIDYKITYHIDVSAKNDNPGTCTVNDTITLNDPELKGYDFDGWYLNDEGDRVSVLSKITSDIDLYARFTAVHYSVCYHDDGAAENDNPLSITIEDEIELNDPVKTGYSFGGWFTSESFSEDSRIMTLKDVSDDIDLYAKWSLTPYTITYSDCGALVNLNQTSCTCTDIIVLSDPLRINYEFVGWYSDEEMTNRITELSDVYGDVTVYAKYSPLTGHKYQYSMSGTADISGTVCGISGNITARYSNYNGTQYLYSVATFINVTYGGYEFNSYDYISSAIDSDSFDSLFFEGGSFSKMEYIDTIDGKVYAFKIIDGSDYVYCGSNGVIYLGYSDNGDIAFTMALDSRTVTEVKDTYAVIIEHSNAIGSVTGSGDHAAGEYVELSYGLSEGYTFSYWVPQGLEDLSSSTIKIDNISEDLVLYAWCYGDKIYTESYSSPSWTVTDGMTDSTVLTSNASKLIVNLQTGHYYIFTFTGKTSGWWSQTVSKTFFVSGGGSATISYSWKYSYRTYTMDWSADVDTYVEYRQKELNSRSQSNYVSENVRFVEYKEQYIKDFAALLKGKVSGLSDLKFATYILCFVQEAIPYELDSDYNGQSEYWKYPYETLFDKSGDCEDTSILYCTLMKAYGYGTALLLYTGSQYVGMGHCAAGLIVTGASGTYYEVSGSRYFYCETTAKNNQIGEIPKGYSTSQVVVIP